MGFDNECILNIHSVASNYFCPVCRTIACPDEAFQTICGHLFCKPCLLHIANSTKACPYDQYSVTEDSSKPVAETNKNLAETIGNIAVRCVYNRSGCMWQGSLSACMVHRTSCAYGEYIVECTICHIQIPHRQAEEHAQICNLVMNSPQNVWDAATSGAAVSSDQSMTAIQAGVPTSHPQAFQITPTENLNQPAITNPQPQALPAYVMSTSQWSQLQYLYPVCGACQQGYLQIYPYPFQGTQPSIQVYGLAQSQAHVQTQAELHPLTQVPAQPQHQSQQAQTQSALFGQHEPHLYPQAVMPGPFAEEHSQACPGGPPQLMHYIQPPLQGQAELPPLTQVLGQPQHQSQIAQTQSALFGQHEPHLYPQAVMPGPFAEEHSQAFPGGPPQPMHQPLPGYVQPQQVAIVAHDMLLHSSQSHMVRPVILNQLGQPHQLPQSSVTACGAPHARPPEFGSNQPNVNQNILNKINQPIQPEPPLGRAEFEWKGDQAHGRMTGQQEDDNFANYARSLELQYPGLLSPYSESDSPPCADPGFVVSSAPMHCYEQTRVPTGMDPDASQIESSRHLDQGFPHQQHLVGDSSATIPAHPFLGWPDFQSSYTWQGFPNAGPFCANYQGGSDPFDQSWKTESMSMGWCCICKVDYESLPGLKIHCQTREHQQLAMDVVNNIKQRTSNAHSGPGEGSKLGSPGSHGCISNLRI